MADIGTVIANAHRKACGNVALQEDAIGKVVRRPEAVIAFDPLMTKPAR